MTAPASTPKIELSGVKKRFGSKVVLDGVDLTIERQSSLVIIGGSGTGKSVTIKCILGILTPGRGHHPGGWRGRHPYRRRARATG